MKRKKIELGITSLDLRHRRYDAFSFSCPVESEGHFPVTSFHLSFPFRCCCFSLEVKQHVLIDAPSFSETLKRLEITKRSSKRPSVPGSP